MAYWRQKPRQKHRKAATEVVQERDARRMAALVAVVAEVGRSEGLEMITHMMVADRAGVPLPYLQWKYPSVENLRAAAEASSRAGSC